MNYYILSLLRPYCIERWNVIISVFVCLSLKTFAGIFQDLYIRISAHFCQGTLTWQRNNVGSNEKVMKADWYHVHSLHVRQVGERLFHYDLLGGDTTAPSGLYARLCHAFLVHIFFALQFTACHSVRVWVAAWRSGSVVGLINEVTLGLRLARLLLAWVTIFRTDG